MLHCIDAQSNHPLSIIRQTSLSINLQINNILCNDDRFYQASIICNKAFKDSGFNKQLVYKPREAHQNQWKNRACNIIWFNLPYSANIQTNVGRTVLELVDKSFLTSNTLYEIYNRNTIKLTYSCMNNVASIISMATIRKYYSKRKWIMLDVIALETYF